MVKVKKLQTFSAMDFMAIILCGGRRALDPYIRRMQLQCPASVHRESFFHTQEECAE